MKHRYTVYGWLVCAGSALLIGNACGCGYKERPTLPETWEILERDTHDSRQVSRTAMLIADNQIHHLYGDPFLHRNVFADRYVSSFTIRPPQLDLFGQDLFRWALDAAQPMPVIHLGDALDLACEREFDEFVAIMRSSGRTWVMTPGNHDAFFYGNFDSGARHWKQACRRGGRPMHKHLLITRYIEELGRTRPTLLARFQQYPEAGEWTCIPGVERDCFLRKLAWKLDPHTRARSFIVQHVDLSQPSSEHRFGLILVDSTQYATSPRALFLHAGVEGSLLADQARVVHDWLRRAARANETVALATHHPYDTLSRSARALFRSFMAHSASIVMISAHTHRGRYYTHGAGDSTWLELNIGSILDWPAEYRTLAFRHKTQDPGDVIIASELIRLEQQWHSDLEPDTPRCDNPAWEAKPGDPDDYLDYHRLSVLDYHGTQRAIYDNLLAAYARMARCLPHRDDSGAVSGTADDAERCHIRSPVGARIERAIAEPSVDDKRRALMWLRSYEDQGGFVNDLQRRAYRLCQASWASRYEDRRARVPHVEDEYIVVKQRGQDRNR